MRIPRASRYLGKANERQVLVRHSFTADRALLGRQVIPISHQMQRRLAITEHAAGTLVGRRHESRLKGVQFGELLKHFAGTNEILIGEAALFTCLGGFDSITAGQACGQISQ